MSSADQADDPRIRGRPVIAGDCLFARPGFYHNQEKGLRLAYCSPSITASLASYLSQIFDRASGLPSTTLEFSAGEIEAGVFTAAELKKKTGTARLIYCESECAKFEGMQADEEIQSTPFPSEAMANKRGWLPRRFYRQSFDLILTDGSFQLIYSLPGTLRYVMIRATNPTAVSQIQSFLRDATSDAKAIYSRSGQAGIFVSGVYAASVGGAGKEILILSSGTDSTRIPLTIGDENGTAGSATFEASLFLFPLSSVVFRRDDPSGFRFMDAPNLKLDGATPDIPAPGLDNAVAGRVLTRGFNSPFGAGAPCLIEDPCSPEDLHPSLYQSFPRADLPACAVEDIELTEFNPFGLIRQVSDSIDPGGKFIELRVMRRCMNQTLLISVGKLRLALPLRLEPGLLVLAANRSLFEVTVEERTSMRSLHPEAIEIRDHSTTRRYDLDPQAHYIYGSKTGAMEILRVHSLVSGPDGFTYHNRRCQGLLRVYCPDHGMSPGYTEDSPNNGDGNPGLFFSEMVPFGADRFLEIYCRECRGQQGLLWFRVIRESDQREDLYFLPVPDGSLITISPASVCGLPDSHRIHFSDLYLPAGPGRIRLPSRSLFPSTPPMIEETVLDSATYSLIRKELRSYERLPGGAIGPSGSPVPNGCIVHSSPGSAPPLGLAEMVLP